MRASYFVDLAREAGMMATDVEPEVQEEPENDDSEATDYDTNNQNSVADPKEMRKKKDIARKPSKKSKFTTYRRH